VCVEGDPTSDHYESGVRVTEQSSAAAEPCVRPRPLSRRRRLPATATFSRFAVVGVANTLIDYALFLLLANLLQLSLDTVWIAKVLSGTVAMANSFYWNRRWVFRSSGAPVGQAWRFVVTTVTGVYVVQAVLTHLFASRWPAVGEAVFDLLESTGIRGLAPAILTESLVVKSVAFAIATAASMTFNFTMYRFWVFRGSRRPSP
jgi:putative flippase GtrA